MKNIKTINIINFVIACTLILFACSTDNPVQQTTKSKSELIIGKWLTDYIILKGTIIPKSKISAYGIVFNNSVYTEIDSNNNTLSTGKWIIKADTIEFTEDSSSTSDSYRIQDLDSAKFVFSNISASSPTFQQFFIRAK